MTRQQDADARRTDSTPHRLTMRLTGQEYDTLKRLAKDQHRSPSNQALHWLLERLQAWTSEP